MGYYDTTGVYLGAQEQRLAASNTPTNKTSLAQQDFLTLLVAQLTHQDPLNPMQDTDMTSQLAQFSSLEQLTGINDGVKSLNSAMTQTDMLSAAAYIGKEIKAEGYKISINEGNASTIYYGFGEPVTNIFMNIYDGEGAIIRTVELGSKEAGTYQYKWDGRNEAGQLMPDGIYGVGILGRDVSGGAVMVQTEISGTVDAVVNEGGTQYLRLKDGRFISFLNVKEIVDPGSKSITDDTDTSEGAEG
ncbi:flagellar hook assembly protein FlgD [Pseudodesulfovibrio pelocollis]|uniref:flagellar hook assembly protein FlgD n=1 Tax=Pseudodesulfovibrio pelocollis TaxID=3051432 RepID=UPI00255B1FC7|nr:flagellar hook assembly protein FlgD [Pseudodesulfovibrio sp. SB368]